jgi:integrating conjugative element protein (TIGR03765 family)
LFLIGADAESLRWLQAHRERLKSIGALGMLVQADTLDDLRTIARLADGLPILPASATDIAEALGIRNYPVLITSHGIEQ